VQKTGSDDKRDTITSNAPDQEKKVIEDTLGCMAMPATGTNNFTQTETETERRLKPIAR
jgi:hypothetical protein